MKERLVPEHIKIPSAAQATPQVCRSFKSWPRLVTMMFGICSRCDALTEVCDGLRAMRSKLSYSGLEKSHANSSANDILRKRNAAFFKYLFYDLTRHYHSFLSASRTYRFTIKVLYIINSTPIKLFTKILKGVGRNPKK